MALLEFGKGEYQVISDLGIDAGAGERLEGGATLYHTPGQRWGPEGWCVRATHPRTYTRAATLCSMLYALCTASARPPIESPRHRTREMVQAAEHKTSPDRTRGQPEESVGWLQFRFPALACWPTQN